MNYMSKDQLLDFIKVIFERNPSTSFVLHQFKDLLQEEGAPREYIDIIDKCIDGFYIINKAVKERSMITDRDIREAEAWHRKIQEERAGRC